MTTNSTRKGHSKTTSLQTGAEEVGGLVGAEPPPTCPTTLVVYNAKAYISRIFVYEPPLTVGHK